MNQMEFLHNFIILFVLLATLLLLAQTLVPVLKTPDKQPFGLVGLWQFFGKLRNMLCYCLISIARMPLFLLFFLLVYGIVLSFYYWQRQTELSLAVTLGLSILTTVLSLAGLALMLAPVIFITQRILFDYIIESQIFRIAIYSVFVPFIYIFVIQDLTPGPLVEGIMLAGMALNFYHIFRGIILCLRSPGIATIHRWGDRFAPISLIVSWLLIIIFNLYTLILLVSNTDPYAFVNNSGPVTEPLKLLYFTIITFTSVGYGDIIPRGSLAVLITLVVAVTGFLYSALFVGSILAAFTAGRRE